MGKRKAARRPRRKDDPPARSLPGPLPPVGIAWFARAQWNRLRAVAEPDAMEHSYDEWKAHILAAIVQLESVGLEVEKVSVDVGELLEWCKERGMSVDSDAWAMFASEKVQPGGDPRCRIGI